MENHLSIGFALKISIEPRSKEFNPKLYKEIILKSISKYLDLSLYDIKTAGNRLYLIINKESFEENIHAFLIETYPYFKANVFMKRFLKSYNKKELTSNDIDKQKFPIKLVQKNEGEVPYIKVDINNRKEDFINVFNPKNPLEYMIYDELDKHIKDIRKRALIFINYCTLWENTEDKETLKILNILSKKAIKNPLKNIVFFY